MSHLKLIYLRLLSGNAYGVEYPSIVRAAHIVSNFDGLVRLSLYDPYDEIILCTVNVNKLYFLFRSMSDTDAVAQQMHADDALITN